MKSIKLVLLLFLNLQFIFSQENSIEIKNLNLNDKTDHFGVSYLNNNQVVLTANSTTSSGKIKTYKNAPEYDLFIYDIDATGELINMESLDTKSKISSFNIASSTFSPDGKYIYITTNFKPKGTLANGAPKPMRLRIERGEFVAGKGWTNFETLPFCDTDFSYGQPAISPDGKTLYFVSSMQGSLGSTDIYKVEILGNSTYGKPQQLSESVNSRAKEVFPFVSDDGYLYYAAKKREGFGRLDIYKSKILSDGNYGPSEILPEPINSPYDDYGFIIKSKTNSGYFSSNRRGGKGGEDVYFFNRN